LKKGDLGGFSGSYKIPPTPFPKGGIKPLLIRFKRVFQQLLDIIPEPKAVPDFSRYLIISTPWLSIPLKNIIMPGRSGAASQSPRIRGKLTTNAGLRFS
jgi:hypothetical protein